MAEEEELVKSTGGQTKSKRNDKINYTTMSLRIRRSFRERISIESRKHGMTMYNWILATLEAALDENVQEKERQAESELNKQLDTINQKLDTLTNIVSKL